MRKAVKSLIISLVFALCSVSTFGQRSAQLWWHSLEQGKFSFRNGDYGRALLSFEDARRQRRAMYERMERDLIDFLSLPEVRRLGNSLDWVERFANERHHTAAAAALRELFFRVPRESLGNSVTRAFEALGDHFDGDIEGAVEIFYNRIRDEYSAVIRIEVSGAVAEDIRSRITEMFEDITALHSLVTSPSGEVEAFEIRLHTLLSSIETTNSVLELLLSE